MDNNCYRDLPCKLHPLAFTSDVFRFSDMVDSIETNGEWAGWVPLSIVRFNPSINPRKHVNKVKLQQIEQSLWTNGQEQNARYRLSLVEDGAVEVVSGNTRTQCMENIEGVESIWAKVSKLADAEAETLAGVENVDRANMTVIEEVDYAVKELNKNGNDEEAVCRRFSWTKRQFKTFKSLTYCSLEVRSALADLAISIGHAEVLATLSSEMQLKVLNVIISDDLTIQQTKERVKNLERELKSACFDTTDCSSCQHNTSVNIDIFDTIESGSRCRDGACWKVKTISHLELLRAERSTEYGKVLFDVDVVNGTTAILVDKGAKGVGQVQRTACASCASYGCIIKTKEGSEAQERKDVCFDLSCHSTKVEAYHNVIATDSQSNEPVVTGITVESKESTSITTKEKPVAKNNSKASTKKAKPKAAPKVKQIPKKMELYALKALTKKAADIALTDSNLVQVAATVSLLFEVGGLQRDEIVKSCGVKLNKELRFSSREAYYSLLYTATSDQLSTIQTAATVYLMSKEADNHALRTAEYNKVAISALTVRESSIKGEWALDKEFLDAMPSKPAIINFLADVKFGDAYELVNGENSYSKLQNEKADPFKEAILKFKFDWSQHLPDLLAVDTYRGK